MKQASEEKRRLNLRDPKKWRGGRTFAPVIGAIFDAAEKLLVVAAFSAAAQISLEQELRWLSGLLSFLFAVYIFTHAETTLASLFSKMQWFGFKAYVVFVFILGMTSALVLLGVYPFVVRISAAIASVTA